MRRFSEILNEDSNETIELLLEGKNLHMEHLEDAVLNDGRKGVYAALNFVKSVTEMLDGNASRGINITVKWDGAPAVFCGTNPENGKFFVATKSLFNKTPKINYTNADIDKNHSGGLADKLKLALKYLKKLGIKGILQGDMLYSRDELDSQRIDGETFLTFQPNTIVYAVPIKSDLAKTIKSSKMGIIFHTAYRGKTIENLTAVFNPNVSGLRKTRDVWFDNATLKDVSGSATLTSSETTQVENLIDRIEDVVTQGGSVIQDVADDDALMLGLTLVENLKIFINSNVRRGITKNESEDFIDFMSERYDDKINALKSAAGRERKSNEKKEGISNLRRMKLKIDTVFRVHSLLNQVKILLVRKLEKVKAMPSFIKTDNGFKVTSPEGFVAIDRHDNALKLVDRMEFSRQNFNAAKNWIKG